jgi:very-short-patch-repair endonuclease
VRTSARTYYADLGYPRWRIAIEYDGAYHFDGDPGRARFDNDRIEAMIDANWRVLRLTAHDLRDPSQFLKRLDVAINKARR